MSIAQITTSSTLTLGQWFAELWRFRDLLFLLAWREVLLRYKQAVFGIAWALIRPLLTMIIMVLVFQKVAGLSHPNAPYALVVLAALLPWQLVANTIAAASNALVANVSMINKVYFPRAVLPFSQMAVVLLDTSIALGLFALIALWYGWVPSIATLSLPLWLLLGCALAFGPSLLIAALAARYRDFIYVVPFVLQVGMYVSPVGFLTSAVPAEWQLLFSLNPMVGLIDGMRWALLGDAFNLTATLISLAWAVLFLWLGAWFFRATEHDLAETI